MVVTSKHRTHKVMEAAIRELMGAGTPPRFKFKDTYASIEFPTGYTIPAEATLEAKYDELLALEEGIQKTVMEGDLEVGTSNLFVDTQTGNVGIGTASPALNLHVMGGIMTQNNGTITPQIQFKSGDSNTNGWLVRANISDTYAGDFTIDRQDNSVTPSKFVIKNNGNVGIGTTSPVRKLEVYTGNGSIPGLRLRRYPTGATYTDLRHADSPDGLAIHTSDGNATTLEVMRVCGISAGRVSIGGGNPKAKTHIGKLSANSGSHTTIPSSNMGVASDFPDSTHLWLGNHSAAEAEDYWGMALGALYNGNSYIQTLDKSNSSYYNLIIQPNGGNVGIGTTNPTSKLHIETSSTSSGTFMRVDASSVTNTGYSEIQMIGPGQTSQGLSMFCNGSGRTSDGGASATTVRNNNGPIILGNSSYVNRIRKPKDDDFICGKWTTTLDASAATTVITNLRSCVSTPSAGGNNMSGNIGRFTAPEDGYYFACCQTDKATRNNSNLLIVYEAGGTDFATNNPNVGTYNEIIDLRATDNVEETYNKVFVLHMKQNNFIQFRVHSSGYIDSSSKVMQCYAYLLNRI